MIIFLVLIIRRVNPLLLNILLMGLTGFLQNLVPNVQDFFTSAIGNAVNAGLDSLGLSQHGRDQYFNANLQREFLLQQQEFQREMTGVSQDFTREMYARQLRDYPELLRQSSDQQFKLWSQQFDTQNKYNSPSALSSRLLSAGINPAAVFGGAGASSTNSMGASSLPSNIPQISATPSSTHASPIGLPSGAWAPAQTMSDLASIARDFASAKKAGVESDQLEKLFDYEVAERTARIFGQRLANDAQSIANYVNDQIKDTKVRMAAQELLKLIADTKNIDQDTALKYEKIFTERSQQLLNLARKKLTDEDYELLKLKVDNFHEEFKTTMANIRSSTQRNISESKLNDALSMTEDLLRLGRHKAIELANRHDDIANELLQNDLWVSNRTINSRINGLIHMWEREGLINSQEAEKLYQMSIESDWAKRNQFIKYVGATARAIGDVLSGSGSALSGGASWKNAKWNNINYRERNRIQEEVGKKRNEIFEQYYQDRQSDRRRDVLGPEWDLYNDQWPK